LRLLDLFCGQGGAAMGYHRAGFEVVGVDNKPQPRYPFEFHQADALDFPLDGFDVIHASPPCPRFSTASLGRPGLQRTHRDLVGPIRARLVGRAYVIENVPGAPLRDPVTLCGSMFGLGVNGGQLRRHRLFESSVQLSEPPLCCHRWPAVGVYGHGTGSRTVWGNPLNADDAREAMQMPWASRDGVAQAIPPAYTEWIGRQLGEVISNP
jgi:DNA (cytosine-5)-methyltransferase 1